MTRESGLFFSVIIPVYNGEKYLIEAIQSVIHQTFSDWELIIIDDGSTDNSLSIAKEWGATDSRIRILQHPASANKGVSTSRNLGMRSSSGQWICFLDADDYWYENKLEFESEILKSNSELVLLYSRSKVTGLSSSGNIGEFYGAGEPGLTIQPFLKVLKGFQGHISSAVVNRNSVIKNGLFFKEDMKFAEDTLFFHQLLLFGNMYYITDILSVYRFHNDSSCSRISSQEKILGRFSVYERLLSEDTGKYVDNISFELVGTGMEKIWKNLLKNPILNFKLLPYSIKRVLKNHRVKLPYKIYLLSGPLPVILKAFQRKITRK